ncbi:Colicin V production protein [Maioricimonas rarisocia]|uniref:Colicin V production protein n=1 Tax=Maioricimonas rarisocia TaxID=2528026 RepID=A0A517Z3M2_9PLAN|nr:CvpA family protein [Maioricimonas rarisocia]QDU37058.1 Colicin V production protein [Maioricimonas rarisocia]
MWYDLVVIAIIGFTTVRGAARGVIWQLAGITGLVLSLAFAESISAAFGPSINLQPPLNNWVVMFGAYLFFSFVAFGTARLMNDWIEKANLKEYNQHLGAVLGAVKGVAICLVLTFFVVTLSEDAREALRHSRSGRAAAIIMDRLHPVMPEKLHDALAKYIHQLDSPDLDLHHNDHDHGSHDGHDHGHDDDGIRLLDTLTGNSGSGASGDYDPFLGSPEPMNPDSGGIPTPVDPGQQNGSTFDAWLGQIDDLLGDDLSGVVSQTLRSIEPGQQRQLRDRMIQVLQNTHSRDMTQLRQELLQAGSDELIQTLDRWSQGKPKTESPATSVPGATAQRREELLFDIAGQYTSNSRARNEIARQLDQEFVGLPDQVAVAVLEDLRADLWAAQPDPDPGTSITSSLELRMVRQLEAAGIPVSRLTPALQSRLRSETPR